MNNRKLEKKILSIGSTLTIILIIIRKMNEEHERKKLKRANNKIFFFDDMSVDGESIIFSSFSMKSSVKSLLKSENTWNFIDTIIKSFLCLTREGYSSPKHLENTSLWKLPYGEIFPIPERMEIKNISRVIAKQPVFYKNICTLSLFHSSEVC